MMKNLFTSEAVSEGHPDKVCDQIADRILDVCLKLDKKAHVACEVFATEEYVLVGGEISCNGHVDYENIVRTTLKEIGYLRPELGIGYNTCKVDIRIREQSKEINAAVNKNDDLNIGAGDQGIVFGYASDETDTYMPLPISLANELSKRATKLFKEGKFKSARPDMKSQVTFDYDNMKIDTILLSVQHDEDVDMTSFKEFIHKEIVIPVVLSYHLNTDFNLLINPSGSFVVGGPKGDTGLTGRKLVCDTYGGSAHQGGGAMSGKDPTKVDRSGAYYARYIAKNLVAAGVAKRLEVQIGYAIGVAKPVSIGILTFKSAKYSDEKILEIIDKVFDARPGAIIKNFKLTEPEFRYQDVATFGHFGRNDLSLPWEKLDKVALIQTFLK